MFGGQDWFWKSNQQISPSTRTMSPHNLGISMARSFLTHQRSPIFWLSKRDQILKERIVKIEISPRIFFDFASTPQITVSKTLHSQSVTCPRKHRNVRKEKVEVFRDDLAVRNGQHSNLCFIQKRFGLGLECKTERSGHGIAEIKWQISIIISI